MRRTGPLGHRRSEINKGDYMDTRFGCTTRRSDGSSEEDRNTEDSEICKEE
jgi:hypothetical protein